MIRIPRFRTKRVGNFVIRFGNPFVACEHQPLLVPIQRNDKFKNELLSASGQSSFTRALASVASIVVPNRTFDVYVCVYIEQNKAVENNRIACHTQLQGGERGQCSYLFTINLTDSDGGMPSEESIQTISMIMHTFLADRKKRKVAFFIGCLKGLNRTGYMCCAVLNRLFGVDVHRAHVLYRAAHYPGIVKQSFVSGLLVRYATRSPRDVHVLDRVVGNVAFHNLVHQDVHGDTMGEEHSSRGCTQPLPLMQPAFVKVSKGKIQWGVYIRNGRSDGDFVGRVSCSGAAAALRAMVGWTRSISEKPELPLGEAISMLRSGFSKTVPMTVQALGFDGTAPNDLTRKCVQDMAVSIKADGTHGTLFIAPYGAYLLLRGDETNDDESRRVALHSVPIWAKPKDASQFVRMAMFECELVEHGVGEKRLLCFDMIMCEDWDRNTTLNFEARTTRMKEYFDLIEPSTLRSQPHSIAGGISVETKPFYFARHQPEVFGNIMRRYGLDEHFGWLADEGRNDGLVVSRASSNVIVADKTMAHMKIKTNHTIDLLVDHLGDVIKLYCLSNGSNLSVAVYGSEEEPEYSYQNLKVSVPKRTADTILRYLEDNSMYNAYMEFKVVFVDSEENPRLMLAFEKIRSDITRANAKLTVDSCMLCTVSEREKELPENIARIALELDSRKRKRGL